MPYLETPVEEKEPLRRRMDVRGLDVSLRLENEKNAGSEVEDGVTAARIQSNP